ncbi:rhamnan synthesis F family protein [Psychromonas sp. SP041]|uniref:rhamnan synthesis F family protein n=1 Tax=Psychromonas sp. SP041 TaxID=1365007 RepID=UPI0004138D7F|nr:rhamnan synthesis F family protein [Psychromonas sp. SP041]
MNYRAIINRLPLVGSVLRSNPKLMQTAVNIENKLIKRVEVPANEIPIHVPVPINNSPNLLNDAKKHGLFNFAWYCDVQDKPFDSEASAFNDYLMKSRFSSVSPSPAFNNWDYLKNNLDVYHFGLSPLEHYISTGIKEGRINTPFAPRWEPKDKLYDEIDTTLIKKQKIAVCLHVFYEDFLDYYRQCLEHFPVNVDVFISVSDIALKDVALEKLGSLITVNNIEVVAVPNRGRNFGPMLVEYGQKLLNYDLFCHLHSKKSLYSGRPQTQWADYLGEFLLNDANVIAKAITHMAKDNECGIYYPTSFMMMPDWVNHWLKNKPFKNKLFDEWQIKDHSEFLAYPVGGMFWAKPNALKQLLEKEYKYEDFPAEPLPNDGSELHALERTIGLLAERNGYKQLFYYPELGRFTKDKSHIFANYVCSQEQLLHKIQPFDIISFDVFDTLVRRSHFVPDYAKLKLGQYLVEQGEVKDAHAFVKLRNAAEFTVRKQKNFKGDVKIVETYQQLGKELSWDEEKSLHYSDMEFAYDLDMIESKDEVVDILNALIGQRKTVYIISDTYYSEHQIVLMLRKAGVTNGYQLYVSSELDLRKDSGTMWAFMKEHLADKGSFVHVGDNAVADAQIPGDFGLTNLHILNPMDKWQAAGWDNPFNEGNELNEQQILKWGPLISQFGRFPFLGE